MTDTPDLHKQRPRATGLRRMCWAAMGAGTLCLALGLAGHLPERLAVEALGAGVALVLGALAVYGSRKAADLATLRFSGRDAQGQ